MIYRTSMQTMCICFGASFSCLQTHFILFYTKQHLKFGKNRPTILVYVISAQIFSCILLVFSIEQLFAKKAAYFFEKNSRMMLYHSGVGLFVYFFDNDIAFIYIVVIIAVNISAVISIGFKVLCCERISVYSFLIGNIVHTAVIKLIIFI